MTEARLSDFTAGPKTQVMPLAVSAVLLAGLIALARITGSETIALAGIIGAVAGFAFYQSKFGFAGGWRRFQNEGRTVSIRAQILFIGASAIIALPLMAYSQELFDHRVGAFIFPFGMASAIGAFMFGVGMQLGGSCASGTLFVAGGGSTRMLVVLSTFVAGSTIGHMTLPMWAGLPRAQPVSLAGEFGLAGALILTLALLGGLYALMVWLEKRRHGDVEGNSPTKSILHGPWSRLLAVAVLVGCVAAILIVLQRPWGVTSAFALWGAKVAYGLGVPAEVLRYSEGAMERTLFADATSVMNLGILLGAFIGAALAGTFAPIFKLTRKELFTAIIGGLLMGYGARLAMGCNIGALLSGIISGSLHGWMWLLFAAGGSFAGVKLRKAIKMD